MNGDRWRQEKHTDIFAKPVLFFHIVFKLVQPSVITHDEIFQALAVGGNVLLPKPFLDIRFDVVVGWKLPASEMYFQPSKRVKVQGGQVGAVRWLGWGLENLIVCYDMCLNKYGNCVEE
jgi:hypothetical protein